MKKLSIIMALILCMTTCVSAHAEKKAEPTVNEISSGKSSDNNVIVEQVNEKQEELSDLTGASKEEQALAVLSAVDAKDETTIKSEVPIVDVDGKECGYELEYAVNGDSYGFAIYNNKLRRITQFLYKEGEKGLIASLKNKANSKNTPVEDIIPILVADKEDPYSIRIVGENGESVDVFGKKEKFSKNVVKRIKNKAENVLRSKKENAYRTVSAGINAKIDYPFVDYSKLKKFVKNRYGKKMYSGYKTDYLKVFNQGNVNAHTGNRYTCAVVAATFALTMQNKLYKDVWTTYNEIYKNAKVTKDGTYSEDVKNSLNTYYKKYFKTNGFKAYLDETKVRFADVKKCVDNNYKALLAVYVKSGGHSVPILGYYSYFFTNENAVDYVIVSTDWYNDCEMYFDSVYLNAGEMYSEADIIYMKPYVYK